MIGAQIGRSVRNFGLLRKDLKVISAQKGQFGLLFRSPQILKMDLKGYLISANWVSSDFDLLRHHRQRGAAPNRWHRLHSTRRRRPVLLMISAAVCLLLLALARRPAHRLLLASRHQNGRLEELGLAGPGERGGVRHGAQLLVLTLRGGSEAGRLFTDRSIHPHNCTEMSAGRNWACNPSPLALRLRPPPVGSSQTKVGLRRRRKSYWWAEASFLYIYLLGVVGPQKH